MLAYISWHVPAGGVDSGAYELTLERFHRSLAHRRPSGMRGSTVFRTTVPPWLRGEATGADMETVYEDWYLLDGGQPLGCSRRPLWRRAM